MLGAPSYLRGGGGLTCAGAGRQPHTHTRRTHMRTHAHTFTHSRTRALAALATALRLAPLRLSADLLVVENDEEAGTLAVPREWSPWQQHCPAALKAGQLVRQPAGRTELPLLLFASGLLAAAALREPAA